METEEDIRRLINEAATDGRVACKFLLDLAARTDTPAGRIGEICNEMDIRVSDCQLGCVGKGKTHGA